MYLNLLGQGPLGAVSGILIALIDRSRLDLVGLVRWTGSPGQRPVAVDIGRGLCMYRSGAVFLLSL